MRITLRDVHQEDEKLLLAWRNDELTRAMSVGRRALSARAHHTWFQNNRPSSMWIGVDKTGADVGVFRGDPNGTDNCYEVAITIGPEHRGRGIGTALIKQGTLALRYRCNARLCEAKIRIENAASIRAFQRAGYLWHGASKDRRFIYMRWDQ